ncbi:MAG: cytochrome aa3 quinol oxidase subunit IV [Gorillibacterium sp.]|nr:cytochrome aa3 quinol oxidase subunit IV [Gorillibacterium sp.]
MLKLFPIRHVMGYLFSLVLSVVALSVVYFELSVAMGLTILLVTAFIQASVQLFVFMHISETASRKTLYLNMAYALFVALVTIFGTLFAMVWGWY